MTEIMTDKPTDRQTGSWGKLNFEKESTIKYTRQDFLYNVVFKCVIYFSSDDTLNFNLLIIFYYIFVIHCELDE